MSLKRLLNSFLTTDSPPHTLFLASSPGSKPLSSAELYIVTSLVLLKPHCTHTQYIKNLSARSYRRLLNVILLFHHHNGYTEVEMTYAYLRVQEDSAKPPNLRTFICKTEKVALLRFLVIFVSHFSQHGQSRVFLPFTLKGFSCLEACLGFYFESIPRKLCYSDAVWVQVMLRSEHPPQVQSTRTGRCIR